MQPEGSKVAWSEWPWPVCHRRVGSPPVAPRMRVSLVFIERRVNVWLRFGRPVSTVFVDRWRSVATFEAGQLCCRVRWQAHGVGRARSSVVVLQAPVPSEAMQRIAGVTPGSRLLLRADDERAVKSMLELVDEMEAAGLDPSAASASYWLVVGNRLAANQALPRYTGERQAAQLARGNL